MAKKRAERTGNVVAMPPTVSGTPAPANDLTCPLQPLHG
jgi:hypothetical protein